MSRNLLLVCLSLFLAAHALADAPTTAPARQDEVRGLDQIVPELRFDDVPLEDAIDVLRQKSRANIIIRWDGFQQAGIEKTAKVKIHLWDLPVRQAVGVVIAAAGGSAEIDYDIEGSLLIVSSARFDSPNYEVKVFDIRDMLEAAVKRRVQMEKLAAIPAPPPVPDTTGAAADAGARLTDPISEDNESQKLVNLITDVIDPKAWDAPAYGKIRIWNGRLFVKQSPVVQKHVAEFLEQIRKSEPAGTGR